MGTCLLRCFMPWHASIAFVCTTTKSQRPPWVYFYCPGNWQAYKRKEHYLKGLQIKIPDLQILDFSSKQQQLLSWALEIVRLRTGLRVAGLDQKLGSSDPDTNQEKPGPTQGSPAGRYFMQIAEYLLQRYTWSLCLAYMDVQYLLDKQQQKTCELVRIMVKFSQVFFFFSELFCFFFSQNGIKEKK